MGSCKHLVLFCRYLSSGGLGLPTFDRIQILLEYDTICEAIKSSISQYILCRTALRSMVLFLVPRESEPEPFLGQYIMANEIYSLKKWFRLVIEVSLESCKHKVHVLAYHNNLPRIMLWRVWAVDRFKHKSFLDTISALIIDKKSWRLWMSIFKTYFALHKPVPL